MRKPVDFDKMTGLEMMQAMAAGQAPPPPMALLLGFQLVDATEGEAVFTCLPRRAHYNPLGTVHGGLAGTLLDSAMGCAVHTLMKPGQNYKRRPGVYAILARDNMIPRSNADSFKYK